MRKLVKNSYETTSAMFRIESKVRSPEAIKGENFQIFYFYIDIDIEPMECYIATLNYKRNLRIPWEIVIKKEPSLKPLLMEETE